MWTWALSTLEFNFDLEDDMSYINPKRDQKLPPIEEDGDVAPLSLEEEILTMEKYRKEFIKKYGGEQYKRELRRLIRKKQKQASE